MPIDTLQSAKILAILRSKMDDETYEFFRSIINDISGLRLSLLGINRDPSGGLTIHNQPIASQIGDQLVFEMNKAGKIAIRQREPRFPYASLDVAGGRIFCDPPHARFSKTTDTAGVGNYIWAQSFNNEPDMIQLTGGGSTITITDRGYYRFMIIAQAENTAGVKTLVRATWTSSVAGLVQGSHGPLLPAAGIFTHVIWLEGEFYRGDTVLVELVTGATRIGAGNDNRSRIWVTRIN